MLSYAIRAAARRRGVDTPMPANCCPTSLCAHGQTALRRLLHSKLTHHVALSCICSLYGRERMHTAAMRPSCQRSNRHVLCHMCTARPTTKSNPGGYAPQTLFILDENFAAARLFYITHAWTQNQPATLSEQLDIQQLKRRVPAETG